MKIQVSTGIRVKMPLRFRAVARKGKHSIEKFCSKRLLQDYSLRSYVFLVRKYKDYIQLQVLKLHNPSYYIYVFIYAHLPSLSVNP